MKVQVPGNSLETVFWGTAMLNDTGIPYHPTYANNENVFGEVNVNEGTAFLPAADFTYEPASEPSEKTLDPALTVTPGNQQVIVTAGNHANKPNGVRFYNITGQQMQQPSGLTIVVTTYSDGTTSAVKVVK